MWVVSQILRYFDSVEFWGVVMVVIVTGFVLMLTFLYTQVKNWVKELRKMLGNEICLCIVGKHHYF